MTEHLAVRAGDPELAGIVALAAQITGAGAVLLAHPVPGAHPLRGGDGVVRGALAVDGAALDDRQRAALDALAGQAGALLEHREREAGLLDAVGALLRSNDDLGAFAGRIAHDLRSPLSAVLGFLALADGPFRDETSDRAAECVASALAAARRMRALIDDLLAHATFTARPRPAPVDLPALVGSVVDDLADVLRATGGTVDYEGPDGVRSDPTLLRQLVQNLVGNALVHGRPGGRVRVRAAVDGAVWTLEVADDGPGVPVAERERVFDPFVRLTGPGAGPAGSGIGLATCARITEALGGSIAVGDADTGGAAFRVVLPVG